MPIVTVTLPSDQTTADVADYNDPITQILSVLNGQLDDANITSLNGAKIIANTLPLSALSATAKNGWIPLSQTPNTMTYNGQNNYDIVYNGVDLTPTISPGMKHLSQRSVTAPTQCTVLNGTNHFWSKASPAAMTFTNNFVVDVAFKSINTAVGVLVSRFNGISGYQVYQEASGGRLIFTAYNGAAANAFTIASNHSVIVTEKTRFTGQMDMTVTTNTPTTNYIMIDGVDVPCTITRGGTNPTSLLQAGNLEIGSSNGGASLYSGTIYSAAIFNAKVTQAQMRTYHSQGYLGTETSLISAFNFNGNGNDANTTNANNLTANNSVTASTVDSIFANGVGGSLDYGVIQIVTVASGNTTINVQMAKSNSIPTTGGVSVVSYSTQNTPYGFPSKDKFLLKTIIKTSIIVAIGATSQWFSFAFNLTSPAGKWEPKYEGIPLLLSTVAGSRSGFFTVDHNTPVNAFYANENTSRVFNAVSTTQDAKSVSKTLAVVDLTTQAIFTPYIAIDLATGSESAQILGNQGAFTISLTNKWL